MSNEGLDDLPELPPEIAAATPRRIDYIPAGTARELAAKFEVMYSQPEGSLGAFIERRQHARELVLWLWVVAEKADLRRVKTRKLLDSAAAGLTHDQQADALGRLFREMAIELFGDAEETLQLRLDVITAESLAIREQLTKLRKGKTDLLRAIDLS